MKCLQRYLCVLLCLVLLLGVFSVSANAEGLAVKPYHIYITATSQSKFGTSSLGSVILYPNNGNEESAQGYYSINGGDLSVTDVFYTVTEMTIANDDSSPLFQGGRSVSMNLTNVFYETEYFYVEASLGRQYVIGRDYVPSACDVWFHYNDGTSEPMGNASISHRSGKGYIDLSFTATPSKDVATVVYILYKQIDPSVIKTGATMGDHFDIYHNIGEHDGDDGFSLSIDRQSEESEKLGGILGWVENIGNKLGDTFNAITSGFASMGNKLTEVFNAIKDLPAKIWEFIENGLKSLFVPDDEYIVSYKDKWDKLLSEKLGAVYQVVNITIESWEQISSADETNTIAMPSVSIPLPDNNEFTFGGSDVQIVPTGFEALATSVKLVTGVACTILFINGLRKRYDEVMGVDE